MKDAQLKFKEDYQAEQIRALTKHYYDMNNIHIQLNTKKERIMEKIYGVMDKLDKKTGKESVGSLINSCKYSITKKMLKYSKKYPKFLKLIHKEIDKWKAFMLEKHDIYFEEHEEKVQEYYDQLEREKNENLALLDALKDANKENEPTPGEKEKEKDNEQDKKSG